MTPNFCEAGRYGSIEKPRLWERGGRFTPMMIPNSTGEGVPVRPRDDSKIQPAHRGGGTLSAVPFGGTEVPPTEGTFLPSR